MPGRRFTSNFGIGSNNMAQYELEVTIEADGRVRVHTQGFKGKTCLDTIRMVERIIGPVQEQQYTHEYYEPDEKVRFQLEQKT